MKSYSGYVHLSPGTLDDIHLDQPVPINTFFWFFEARNNPKDAPLAIWLNGGPGASSLMGLMQEHGPCRVNPDSNSTELNLWSWNNHVNMLYVDQPVHVGYSYDILTNGTLDQITQQWDMSPWEDGVPESNNTFRVGTFGTMNTNKTANTTENAARALWHFAQAWFTEFPAYKPGDDRVSIWTESYGGHYGPAFAAFFQEQNEKIKHCHPGTSPHYIHLDTLGIVNACIDQLIQIPAFPQMAHFNTYGIKAINKTIYDQSMYLYHNPNGCKDQLLHCRRVAAEGGPLMYGANTTVNHICEEANIFCRYQIEAAYFNYSNRASYDIAHTNPDPFPPHFFIGYFNQPWVQAALGTPVNYTFAASSSFDAFERTGDHSRGDTRGYLADLGHLLDSGIKVALMYGDRDYTCNWIGGEAASLHVPYSEARRFRAAGYANIHTNGSYVGGMVRQHGNFSFTRVFQSGHQIPAYQPETAYRIFQRAMFNADIATGKISTAVHREYSSHGAHSTWDVREIPPSPPPGPVCYLLDLMATCSKEQYQSIIDGTATVKDWVVVDADSKKLVG